MRFAVIFLLLAIGPAILCLAMAASARVQATIYSADDCAPCVRYIAAVKAQLPKRGLIVREASAPDAWAADVIITKQAIAGIDSFPTTVIRKDGREVNRISGEITPAKLIEALNN